MTPMMFAEYRERGFNWPEGRTLREDEIELATYWGWHQGICGYCRKAPAVGHDGLNAYCEACRPAETVIRLKFPRVVLSMRSRL